MERQFEEYKQKNMNDPDQDHVEKYINDMNLMKNRVLERRRTLQQKVEQEEKTRGNPLPTSYQGKLLRGVDLIRCDVQEANMSLWL